MTEITTSLEAGMTRCNTEALIRQIGVGNLMAISGRRVYTRRTGITLPVSSGYKVTIDLAANDTYTVRRIMVRGTKVWLKGERTDVYCDEVGEIAYQASCYKNVEF